MASGMSMGHALYNRMEKTKDPIEWETSASNPSQEICFPVLQPTNVRSVGFDRTTYWTRRREHSPIRAPFSKRPLSFPQYGFTLNSIKVKKKVLTMAR